MRENLPWRYQRRPEIANPGGPPAIEYVLSPETEEPRFRDYWKMLVKRRRLIILTFLVVFGLGAFMTFRTTPLYTASTTLRIEPQSTTSHRLRRGGRPAMTTTLQTQVALLKEPSPGGPSHQGPWTGAQPELQVPPQPLDQLRCWVMGSIESFLARIFDFLKVAPEQKQVSRHRPAGPNWACAPAPSAATLHLLSVEPLPKTQLVKVSFSTIDPSLSEELANAHAATFIRMNLETRFELSKEAREFLEKKLAELKVKVGQSEEALNRFRKTHGVVSMEGNENIVVDRMVDLNRRLTEARAKRIELESLSRIVKDKNFTYLSQVIDNN